MQQCRTVITPGRLQRGWIGEEHVFNLTSFQTSTSATSTHGTVKSHQLQPTNLKSHHKDLRVRRSAGTVILTLPAVC